MSTSPPPFPDDSLPASPAFPDHFDRSATRSAKWATAGADGDPRRIPLGVADMDLPGFPGLFAALRERAAHPALGYTRRNPRSRELVVSWYRNRFGTRIDPDWLVQLPFGPRSAVRFLLEALPARGPVLSPSPEYGGFAPAVRAAGLHHEEIPLRRTPGGYRLPVEDFSARARRSGVTAVLLSSPHNPTGRVWDASELRALADAAAAGGGVLVCDEVHSDLVYPGRRHTVGVDAAAPPAEHTVVLHSIGKTFNATGFADSFLVIPSPRLRKDLVRAVEGFGFFEGGTLLGALAQDVAFEQGEPWRRDLVEYLRDNRDLAVDALTAAAPGLVSCVPEASFLLWLDGTALDGNDGGTGGAPGSVGGRGTREAVLRACDLDLQDGAAFGSAGRGFLRLNFALPRPRLREAVGRLTRYA